MILYFLMTIPHTSETSLLDAKLLRLFDLLYTTGSVTRTAEQLGQSLCPSCSAVRVTLPVV